MMEAGNLHIHIKNTVSHKGQVSVVSQTLGVTLNYYCNG